MRIFWKPNDASEPSTTSSSEPTEEQILWTHKLPIDQYERLQAKTHFFQFVLITSGDGENTQLHIDTNQGMYSHFPYQFSIPFNGSDAKEMALKFVHSLKKLEDVAVDYITLVQEHPDIWIEKQREQDEDNQSSNGEREPGQGP
jgi:hypothetical protein